jgi:hypothetical protein
MEAEVLKAVGGIAGIGGLALGVILLLFKDVIGKTVFAGLTRKQSYALLNKIVMATWSVAVLGIAAWYFGAKNSSSHSTSLSPVPPQASSPTAFPGPPPPLPPGVSSGKSGSSSSASGTGGSTSVQQLPPSDSMSVQQMPPFGSNSVQQLPPSEPGPVSARNTAEKIGENQWRWTIFVDADRDTLSQIACVDYILHPSFDPPVQASCTSADNFAFSATGWGTFEVGVRIRFRNGTERQLTHMLTFS